jgi:protein-disulfide isomerase
MKRTRLLYLSLGALLGLAAGIVIGRVSAPDAGPMSRTFDIELEGRPLRGPADARVTVIEFTDYECAFCRRYFETTYPALLSRYGDKIAYTVRHFPSSYQHRRAHRAAQAAECAGDQGGFFQYHQVLFRNTRALDDRSLIGYAARLGLNVPIFRACLESGRKSDVVDDDIQAGIARGLQGTPSFLVNGRVLVGAQPAEVFERHIDRELRGD